MRKPDQNLDEYIVRPTPGDPSEPPQSVSLQRTGEVEVLEPLIRLEDRAEHARTSFRATRPYQPLWFRRFIAVGSGALVVIALVLMSAILVGINDPASGTDVAVNWKLDGIFTERVELFTLDVSQPSTFEAPPRGVEIVRPKTRKRPTRRSIHLAANKPRRQLRRLPQPEQPTFVPTTLVIYAENGVINTRIEPWLQAVNKKPPTFNNLWMTK